MKVLAYIFIIIGAIGGTFVFASIDYQEYQQAKEIADDLWDNEFAQASFMTQKELMIAQVSQGITILLVCVTIGIFLLAIDRIIELLKESNEINRKLLGEQKEETSA